MAERVQVVVRFRPLNDTEKSKGPESCVEVIDNANVNVIGERARKHAFDRVFASDLKQEDVYSHIGVPTIANVVKGYNGTVLAYGQTGSGKTHTMLGPAGGTTDALDTDSEQYGERGLIPRLAEDLFAKLEELDSNEMRWKVGVSVFELYMERIMDSLGESKQTEYRIREDASGGRGVYVENLYSKPCTAASELLEAIRVGASRRRVASTKSNDTSSRSHSVTLITVQQVDEVRGGTAITSRLTLVDLAGSEKVGKTQATGDRLREAQMINLSLTLLGNVIFKLTDGKSAYIPYRDSKLTRLLQDSLGGNSRTTLLCCCSPAVYNRDETITTLHFAARAKQIKNKPRVNRELGVNELKIALAQALEEIEGLKAKIDHQEQMALPRPPTPVLVDDANADVAERQAQHDALVAELQLRISLLMDEISGLTKELFRKSEELQRAQDQIDFHRCRADAAEEALLQAQAKMKREEKLFHQKLATVSSSVLDTPVSPSKYALSSGFSFVNGMSPRGNKAAELELSSIPHTDISGGAGRQIPRRPDDRGAMQARRRLGSDNSTVLFAPPVAMATLLPQESVSDGGDGSPTAPPQAAPPVDTADDATTCAEPAMSGGDTPTGVKANGIAGGTSNGKAGGTSNEKAGGTSNEKAGDGGKGGAAVRHGFVDCGVATDGTVEDGAVADELRRELAAAAGTVEFMEAQAAAADGRSVDFQLRIEELETEQKAAKKLQAAASHRERELELAADKMQLVVEDRGRSLDDGRAEIDVLRRLLELREKENSEMRRVLEALDIDVHEQLDALKNERRRAAGLSDEAKRLAGITEGLKTAWAQQEYTEMVHMELLVKAEDMQAVENEVVAITYGGVNVAEATRQSCLETVEQLDSFLATVVVRLQAQPFANANLESQRLTLLSDAAGLVGRCLVAKSQLQLDDNDNDEYDYGSVALDA